MLNIGERITQLRRQQNLSQEELAKKIGASRTIIGNYERNTNTPSIDMLVKLAQVFMVSLDYLVGEGSNGSFDKKTVKRLQEIEQLEEPKKQVLFDLIDTYIRDDKTRKAHAS